MKLLHQIAGIVCAAVTLTACLPLTAGAASASELQSSIESYAADNPDDYISFVTTVADKDSVLYTGAFGYADLENQLPADEQTVYEWGSISKTMIWVSAMQLWEQGRLDLEKDVQVYLPAGFLRGLRFEEPLTMLDLMNHTGGFTETVWQLLEDDPDKLPTLEEALKRTQPYQLMPPGTASSYSNWSAALAAYVVECVSGESYPDYVRAHILEPLGMEHTSVDPACRDNPWVQEQREKLMGYSHASGEWECLETGVQYITISPASCVTSTIGDLTRYAQSFVQKPCPLFEKSGTLDELLKPSLTFGDSDIPEVCHGFMPEQRGGHMVYGHSGVTNACSSSMRFCPDTGTVAVLLANCQTRANGNVMKLVLGELDNITVNGGGITEHKDISGVYFGMSGIHHGPLRFTSLLGNLPVKKTAEDTWDAGGFLTLERKSDSVFECTDSDERTSPCASSVLPDGRLVLDLGTDSYIRDTSMLVSLVILPVYVLLMVIGLVILLVKLVKLILKKDQRYRGAPFITAAQIMRVVSVAGMIVLTAAFLPKYGLSRPLCITVCIVEMLCVLSYAASIGASVYGMRSQFGQKAAGWQYIVNIAANAVSIFAVVSLELYRFWQI